MVNFGAAAVTYRTVINAIAGLIKSNCKNIDGTGSISGVLLSGYSTTYKPTGTGDANGYVKGSMRLSISNPVTSVASSTVTSQFESYVGTYIATSQ